MSRRRKRKRTLPQPASDLRARNSIERSRFWVWLDRTGTVVGTVAALVQIIIWSAGGGAVTPSIPGYHDFPSIAVSSRLSARLLIKDTNGRVIRQD